MVKTEASQLLFKLYPQEFLNPVETPNDQMPFKTSDRWVRKLCMRRKFSLQRIGPRMNKKGKLVDIVGLIEEYHLCARVFQLSEINDPQFGFTSPEYAYSHDKVPLALCPSYLRTLDDKGVADVFDATSKANDLKRFCSLNLIAPLKRKADGSNIPKPHLVFQATCFKTSEEW